MKNGRGKDIFLLQSGRSLASLAVANVGVYIVGSAFKKLDGGLVAGAKWCDCLHWFQNFSCGHMGVGSFPDNGPIDVVGPSCAAASCAINKRTVSGCAPL